MKRLILTAAVFSVLFSLIASVLFVAANWPAIKARLEYRFKPDHYSQAVPNLNALVPAPAQDTLVIPKIAVNAPIVFAKGTDEASLTDALQNGVVHYPTSTLPGEPGTVVITGHSSQLAWQKGEYKSVFALLGKLAPRDSVVAYYGGQKFIYKVTKVATVDPLDLSVFDDLGKPALNLITCWPTGTAARRLVVTAVLIY